MNIVTLVFIWSCAFSTKYKWMNVSQVSKVKYEAWKKQDRWYQFYLKATHSSSSALAFPIIWGRRNGYEYHPSTLSCTVRPPPLTPHFPYLFYTSLSTWFSVFLSVYAFRISNSHTHYAGQQVGWRYTNSIPSVLYWMTCFKAHKLFVIVKNT